MCVCVCVCACVCARARVHVRVRAHVCAYFNILLIVLFDAQVQNITDESTSEELHSDVPRVSVSCA